MVEYARLLSHTYTVSEKLIESTALSQQLRSTEEIRGILKLLLNEKGTLFMQKEIFELDLLNTGIQNLCRNALGDSQSPRHVFIEMKKKYEEMHDLISSISFQEFSHTQLVDKFTEIMFVDKMRNACAAECLNGRELLWKEQYLFYRDRQLRLLRVCTEMNNNNIEKASKLNDLYRESLEVFKNELDCIQFPNLCTGDVESGSHLLTLGLAGLYERIKQIEQKEKVSHFHFNKIPVFILILCASVVIILWLISLKIIGNWQQRTAHYQEMLRTRNDDLETEVRKRTQELGNELITDKTTGLPNRYKLDNDIQVLQWHSMILLDVRGFRNINAAFGFKAGDFIIKLISERLVYFFKETAHVYKLASDEFVLLTTRELSEETILKSLNNINDPPLSYKDIDIDINFYIGRCLKTKGITGGDYLRMTNSALQEAKNKGPLAVVQFNGITEDTRIFKKNMQSARLIKDAIINDTVFPVFQGIYNNRTEKFDKYEALIRIADGSKTILPGDFLDTAKSAGYMPKLTGIILEKCFQRFSETGISLSINISEDDLITSEIVNTLERVLKKYFIAPDSITIEILESESMKDIDIILSRLHELKCIGIKIAIDDFGVRFSNFERLAQMDADFIKIDGSFIKDLHTNKKHFEIVRSIQGYAQSIGLKTVAEFVHNAEIHGLVKAMGIDYSQGFYLHKPEVNVPVV